MIRPLRPLAVAAALVVAAALPAGAAKPSADQAPVRAIAIVVNGQELPADPAPRVVDGRLLVPVARIYGALGISVARSGDDLVASAPNRRIVLTIGSDRAEVDGRPVHLDAPAQRIDGATYVPLRFVTDSLGGAVSYDAKAGRVEVVSTIVGRTPRLAQPLPDGGTELVGEVDAVDRNSAPPSISITRGVAERTIEITSNARFQTQDVVTRTAVPATLDDVHVGDAISILVRKNGSVADVVVRYASRSGTIAAVSPTAFVLGDGYVVTPDNTTAVTLNDEPATLAQLKVGDSVTVRMNPDTAEKRQVIASRQLPPSPQPPGAASIASFTIDATGALKAGDTFGVTLRGTPGGRATFDIGTYLTGIPLPETAPGVYSTRYTVPPGVNFGKTTVYGRLSVAGKDAPRATAPQLLAVTTTPPQIVEIAPENGETVNNPEPSIFATYRTPTDVGIDASSAKIEVNGLDVTSVSTRTPGFIIYTPKAPMADGEVRVAVTVSDNAGNLTTRRFAFTIRR